MEIAVKAANPAGASAGGPGGEARRQPSRVERFPAPAETVPHPADASLWGAVSLGALGLKRGTFLIRNNLPEDPRNGCSDVNRESLRS